MLVQYHAMMIVLLSIHFLRLAFLLVHIFSAAAEFSQDLCDGDIYGRPSYSACVALLYGNPARRSAGIYNIDNDEHGFFLPYFGVRSKFTVNQWRHRVELPELWDSATCKIALLVKADPTGGFTTDSATWAQIADRGKVLLDYCLLGRRASERVAWGGGVGSAGVHGRLHIVVYEPGSAFDRAITSGIGPGNTVVDDGNGMAHSSASGDRIGNLTAVHDAVWNLTDDQI